MRGRHTDEIPAFLIGMVVRELPKDCASVFVNGANWFDCGGVFHKAVFQEHNLVYVVVEEPLMSVSPGRRDGPK
jgi:hypothetical protein